MPRIELDDDRQAAIENLLQRTDSSSRPQPQPSAVAGGKRETHAVDPPTELLARLETFLPQLAASNAELEQLAQRDPASVDIEAVGDDGPYIEMNLGLGVFDMRPASAGPGHVRTPPEEGSDADSNDNPSSSDSTSDSESSSEAEGHEAPAPREIRPLPRRPKPTIEVLSSTDHPSGTNNDAA